MTERLEEILNRKPAKWGSLTIKEFERDIALLQEKVEELEEHLTKRYGQGYRQGRFEEMIEGYYEKVLPLKEQNQRYKQALEDIKKNSKDDDAVAIAYRALEELK